MTILHIDSSILGKKSVSRELTEATVNHLKTLGLDQPVISRDLTADPLGDLSEAEFLAFQGLAPHDPFTKQKTVRNQAVLEEFLNAKIIIIGAPMYNFSIPSQLKSWIDRLVIPGKTFRFTESGPQGLIIDKRVIIISSRGQTYSDGSPASTLDHQESYLANVLGFMGIKDITFIRAEGLALSQEHRDKVLQSAQEKIRNLSV